MCAANGAPDAGNLIGGEGIVVPARLADASPNLDAQRHDQYRFRIGLSQVEPITFLVNVLGEATAGPCEK